MLSVWLISAEDKKGSPLTETEAIRIRDKAPCVMMKVADAAKLEETRGRDIDPENCWHDWQKLRDELGRTPSLPAGPRFNQVQSSEAEYQQTIADARASLDRFRELIAECKKTGAMPMVKTRLVDGENSAFMWLCNAKAKGNGFAGTLFEVPSGFTNHKVGDVIAVPADTVLDWMVNENGLLYGGFSIRLFRQRKPEAERAEYDNYIGVTAYAPLPRRR